MNENAEREGVTVSVNINRHYFGWYDDDSDTPAHDPPHDGPCLICSKPLVWPVKTISFMLTGGRNSYFYRCHKACYEEIGGDDEEYIWAILGQQGA